MAIQISGTTVIDNSRNVNAGVGTFSKLDVPPNPLTFSPADGAVDESVSTNIVITFDQRVFKGTGNITLREGSAGGTVAETIDVTSDNVTISGAEVTINPSSPLPSGTNIYVVVDANAFVGLTEDSGNEIIDTYNFTTLALALGDSYEGGYYICGAAGVRWVVAPVTAEVSRNWYARGDANTRAQQVSGCTGWFVPTCAQLKNPGSSCLIYWDTYWSFNYWSSTPCPASYGEAWTIRVINGNPYCRNKDNVCCVRSFRCVTY